MSTQPFVSSRYRAFDANGNPLAGGLLYTYSAGTSTPLSTYTTRAGDVANANPVVLDADGEADVWMSPGVDYKFVLKNSAGVTQSTVDNFPSAAAQSTSTDGAGVPPGGRLTLTSGTPITTSDVTSATTIYYAPYMSDKVPLYDGTSWTLYSIGAGLSQTTADSTKSPASSAANSNYDLFIWSDGGTLRLSRGPAWVSTGARGSGLGTTELTRINGRYVNANAITNGPNSQRGLYVGTIHTDASSQANDSVLKRNVWNFHNRARRHVKVTDGNSAWTSGTADTYRAVRNSSSNVIEMVRGLSEDPVFMVAALYLPSVSSGTNAGVTGIGFSTDTNAASLFDSVVSNGFWARATYCDLPALIGWYQFWWLECYSATGAAGAFVGSVVGVARGGLGGMYGHCMA